MPGSQKLHPCPYDGCHSKLRMSRLKNHLKRKHATFYKVEFGDQHGDQNGDQIGDQIGDQGGDQIGDHQSDPKSDQKCDQMSFCPSIINIEILSEI